MEEVKKVEEEKKEVKKIVEKIPEDYLKAINEVKGKKSQLMNGFFQASIQSEKLKKILQQLLEKMDNNKKNLGNKIEYAFQKMRLKKRKGYTFQYDGKDSFVGTEKKVVDESKK